MGGGGAGHGDGPTLLPETPEQPTVWLPRVSAFVGIPLPDLKQLADRLVEALRLRPMDALFSVRRSGDGGYLRLAGGR